MSRLGRITTAGLLVALIAGCGSTAQVGPDGAAGESTGSAASSGGALGGSTGGLPPTTGSPESTTTGGASAGVGGGSAGLVTTGGAATSGSTGSVTSGRPTTAPLKVGFVWIPDNNQLQRQFGGGSGTVAGDEKQMIEAVVADVNATGGVAGRRVVASFFSYAATSSTPRDQTEQQACAQFTQDNRVAAAVMPSYFHNLRACLTRAGVVAIGEGYSNSTRKALAQLRGYYEPGGLDLDRQSAALPPALVRQRYFTGWDVVTGDPGAAPVRVGVVTYDTPAYRDAVNGVLVPALKRAGHPAAEIAYLNYPNTNEDAGAAGAAASSAILRFKQQQITHVVMVSEAAAFALLFMEQARGQGYNPRYAYTSQTLPQAFISGGYATDPDGSFNGAKGIGWWPILDLAPGDPAARGTAAFTRCMNVAKRANVSLPSTFAQFVMTKFCDAMWFVDSVVTRAGGVASLDRFVTTVPTLGTSYASPATPQARFDGSQHSGGAVVYDYGYVNACTCWKYSSGPHAVA